MTYKIGQILTMTEDRKVEKVLSGEKVIVPKGSKIIIGADNLAHHFRDGSIQPLAKTDKVEGYDVAGLAEYLLKILESHFPIREMAEDYGIIRDDMLDEIELALDEIGFLGF